MKWTKENYGYAHEGYHQYRCGSYVIRQTHSKNIFTGKEMGHANQVWNIYKDGEKIDYGATFADAKRIVAQIEADHDLRKEG